MQRMLEGGGRVLSSETCTVHSPIDPSLSYDDWDWEYDQIIMQSLVSKYGRYGTLAAENMLLNTKKDMSLEEGQTN